MSSESSVKTLLTGIAVGAVGMLVYSKFTRADNDKSSEARSDNSKYTVEEKEPLAEPLEASQVQNAETQLWYGFKNRVYECVIIGAGLSGLSTAHALVEEHGLRFSDILILDAQSYVGGRVRQTTDFIPGLHIDLGAELIHGSGNTLARIAQENGMHTKSSYVWAQGDDGPLEAPVKGGYGLYYIKTKNAQVGGMTCSSYTRLLAHVSVCVRYMHDARCRKLLLCS